MLECVTPFAPRPLQTLQRYYGAIRHRSGLRYISALFITFGIFLGIPTSASHVPPNEPVSLSCHLYAACHNAIDRLLHCLLPELSDTERPSLISLAVTATSYMEGSQPFIYRCAPRGTRTCHCPAGIVKNKSQMFFLKNEKAGHGPVPCPDQYLPQNYDNLFIFHSIPR